MPKAISLIVAIVIPLAFGFVSLLLGKDINWDLLNYHYYNAYAFLNQRLDFDIAPAQLQTFYNPVLDVPFYLMAKQFPAWVAGFVLGSVHGFNLSLILLIFWKIKRFSNQSNKLLLGICVVLVSSLAPGFISELGNTMNDNLTSLFALSTLFLLLQAFEMINSKNTQRGILLISLAGLVMGVCVGLKPTSAAFALGAALALTASLPTWRNRLIGIITFGISGLIGCLTSAGFWWWELWSRYGNPLMPYFNNIFKSSLLSPVPFIDDHFVPKHIWEFFIWPLIFSYDSTRVSELKFIDIRFAFLYCLCLIWLLCMIFKRFPTSKPATSQNNAYGFDQRSGNFLLVFFLSSFILWMVQSSIYRYIIGLELLVPLCFLIILERITPSRRVQALIAIGTVLLTLFFFRPFNWGRLEWGNAYFDIDTTHLETSGDVMVIMLGRSPISYVIPELPENYRFVRPEGNIFKYRDEKGKIRDRGTEQSKLFQAIKEVIDNHTGTLYILYNKKEQSVQPPESLMNLGILPRLTDCSQLIVNTPDILEICRVVR